jgi:hypothetical protein
MLSAPLRLTRLIESCDGDCKQDEEIILAMSLPAIILKKAFFVIALLVAIFVLGSIVLSGRGESDYGLFAHFTVAGFIRLGAWIGLIILVPLLLKKIFSKRPPK